MNPEDQEDLEAVFGKGAVEHAMRKASDRRAEGYARRKRSTVPDMRRGKKAGQYRFVPHDPQAGFGEGGGRGAAALEPDRPSGRKGSRDRFREPRVEPVKRKAVRMKSGKDQNHQVALTLDEYNANIAKIDAENVALEAARIELEEAAEGAKPLALPISETPPSRFRSVDAEVRRYAAQTELRARPKQEPIDLCNGCGRVKSHYDDRPDIDQLLDEIEPDEADATSDHGDASYFPDLDDRSQWELEHADAIAEDVAAAARAEMERIDAQRRQQESRPPTTALCAHCALDEAQTKKDGLCRWCKDYKKKNAGALPSQTLIDPRKRKREEGF